MVSAAAFIRECRAAGFHRWTGVPCSLLTPLIDALIEDAGGAYLPAANEGDAVAIAAGSWLGGTPCVVFMQNSGLGNAVNPLTSLCETLRIPLLLIVTLRGDPHGAPDEPQHGMMGAITTSLLDLMKIRWAWSPCDDASLPACLADAAAHMRSTARPYALVVKRGVFLEGPAASASVQCRSTIMSSAGQERPLVLRGEWLRTVQEATREEDALLATTGYLGRELYALADRPNQLYIVGSMGCVSSVGLGFASAKPGRRTIVLDGDGAALMRLSAWPAIGHAQPANFLHLLFDNGRHESTGGQPTVANAVDFCALAAGAGYASVDRLADPAAFSRWLQTPRSGPAFLHVPIRPGTPGPLARPAISPGDAARRFAAHFSVPLS